MDASAKSPTESEGIWEFMRNYFQELMTPRQTANEGLGAGASMESFSESLDVESFHRDYSQFAMEAFSFKISLKDIQRLLPDFFGKLKSLVTNFFSRDQIDFALFDERKYNTLTKNIDYMQVRRQRVIVPKGLSTTYAEYLKSLHKAQDTVDLLLSETLHPFERYLAALLHDPDQLKTQSKADIDTTYKLHDLDAVKKEISKNFSKDQAEKREYGELVARQNEWPVILKDFNRLVERVSLVPRSQVLEVVTAITEHLDILAVRMKESPSEYAPSGMTVKSLADISFAMASEVEYYAMHSFMIESLQSSIEYCTEMLETKK